MFFNNLCKFFLTKYMVFYGRNMLVFLYVLYMNYRVMV